MYVFCGRHRPSNIDGAKHSWAHTGATGEIYSSVLARYPNHHAGRQRVLSAQNVRLDGPAQVDYIIGIAKNSRLLDKVAHGIDVVSQLHELTGEAGRFYPRAGSWKEIRVVLAKLEVTDDKGPYLTL